MDSSWFQAIFAAGQAFDAKLNELVATLVTDKATKLALAQAVQELQTAIAEAVKPLATKATAATKTALADAVAPLLSREAADDKFVSKSALNNRLEGFVPRVELAALATDTEVAAAVKLLATKAELGPLASDAELAEAIRGVPSKADMALKADKIALDATNAQVAAKADAAALAGLVTIEQLRAAIDDLRDELTAPAPSVEK